MIARNGADVKPKMPWWERLLIWADTHPRFAWVLALLAHVNILLTVFVFH